MNIETKGLLTGHGTEYLNIKFVDGQPVAMSRYRPGHGTDREIENTVQLPPQERRYTVEQIAMLCGVSRQSVYAWIGQGLLPAMRMAHRKWVITQSQFDTFMRKGSPRAVAPKDVSPQPSLPAELLPTGSGKFAAMPSKPKKARRR